MGVKNAFFSLWQLSGENSIRAERNNMKLPKLWKKSNCESQAVVPKSRISSFTFVISSAMYLRSSDKLFRNHDFFSEKIIVGPQEGETPPPLAQMVLTQ